MVRLVNGKIGCGDCFFTMLPRVIDGSREGCWHIHTKVFVIERFGYKTTSIHYLHNWKRSGVTCTIDTAVHCTICQRRSNRTIYHTKTSSSIEVSSNCATRQFRSDITCSGQRELDIFYPQTSNIGLVIRRGQKLVIELSGNTIENTSIITFIFVILPITIKVSICFLFYFPSYPFIPFMVFNA